MKTIVNGFQLKLKQANYLPFASATFDTDADMQKMGKLTRPQVIQMSIRNDARFYLCIKSNM